MFSPLVFLVLLCGQRSVMSMPLSEGRGIPSRFDRSQVKDCLSQELKMDTDFPFEIRPSCVHVLQHALFPGGTPIDFTQSSDWLSRSSHRVISSEEGLYWLWSLLQKDCGSLKGLLASLATQIARGESTNPEVPDIMDADDSVRKRSETTTFHSDQDQFLDVFRDHLTTDELARLMADRPSSGDLTAVHVFPPSRGTSTSG